MKKIILIFALLSNAYLSFANAASYVLHGDQTGTQWHWQSSIENSAFTALANYGNYLLAADTYNPASIIMKSSDLGYNWFSAWNDPENFNMYDINVLNNNVVALGLGKGIGTIYYSSDSLLWTSTPTESRTTLFSVDNNGKEMVIVGSSYRNSHYLADVRYSKDGGKHWQSANAGLPAKLNQQTQCELLKVIWNGKEWIATGYYNDNGYWAGLIITSPDAMHWEIQSIIAMVDGWMDIGSITMIAANNDEWIATDKHALIRSTDRGKTWTLIDQDDLLYSYATISQIAWNGKMWLITGYGNGLPFIYTSTDGVTWSRQTLPAEKRLTSTSTIYDVLWNGSEWFAIGKY